MKLKTKTSYILNSDGSYIEVTPTNEKFTLTELQMMVGGYIESIPLRNTDHDLICDENGDSKNLPFNETATELCCQLFPVSGTVVIRNVSHRE